MAVASEDSRETSSILHQQVRRLLVVSLVRHLDLPPASRLLLAALVYLDKQVFRVPRRPLRLQRTSLASPLRTSQLSSANLRVLMIRCKLLQTPRAALRRSRPSLAMEQRPRHLLPLAVLAGTTYSANPRALHPVRHLPSLSLVQNQTKNLLQQHHAPLKPSPQSSLARRRPPFLAPPLKPALQ